MPRERKVLPPKPGKDQLFVKRGRKESPVTVEEALKGMKPGEKREGHLGGISLKKPDFVPEVDSLDSDGLARKGAIKNLLIRVIQPNSLGSKSTPEMDRRAFVNKVNKLTLKELRRFLPERVDSLATEQLEQIASGASDIFEEEKAETQQRYMDISP